MKTYMAHCECHKNSLIEYGPLIEHKWCLLDFLARDKIDTYHHTHVLTISTNYTSKLGVIMVKWTKSARIF